MKGYKLFIATLQLVIFLKGTSSIQIFEAQPTYTEVNPGQDAHLACKVYNKKGTCVWQKDNKPVGMYLHKYEWSGSPEAGDCSLLIRVSQLEFDDGLWECQVTASDFTTQDALTSSPVRLVVRVPPQLPRIEYNSSQVLPGHNLTALHGVVASVRCIARYGNPPPLLKWFLDENEITPSRRQLNSTELDNPRTWVAISVLEILVSKEYNGKYLRCVALHESYSTKTSSVEVKLNVLFVPESRLIGLPTYDVEELKDSVSIRCEVTANPRANVLWRRTGQTQPAALQELLQFSPAVRQHAGLYTCVARNHAGEAQPVSVHIDVKYPPKILSIGPDRLITSALFTEAVLECQAEGNPPPAYQWLQKLPTASDTVVERGREAKLHISNVTYDFQGEYMCKVVNVISGAEREAMSDTIALQVVGAPQVLRQSSTQEILAEKGDNIIMQMVACADPRPRLVYWEWSSFRLEAGGEMDRHRVDEVIQDEKEDCYVSTMHIDSVRAMDSMAYYLAVENDRGTDRHSILLHVNEPFDLNLVIGVAGGCLIVFLILLCVCVLTMQRKKCCLTRADNYHSEKMNDEKVDLEKNVSSEPQCITANDIYTTTPGNNRRKVPDSTYRHGNSVVSQPPARV